MMKDDVLYFTSTIGYRTELMRLQGDRLEKSSRVQRRRQRL